MMPTKENNRFTLCFDGHCVSGYSEKDVRQGLVDLFGVSQAEVAPLFAGQAVFLKTDLKAVSLDQYREAFDAIGAHYRYWQQTDPAPTCEAPPVTLKAVPIPSESPETCPKCGAVSANGTECAACGIIFDKYRRAQKRLAPSQPEAPEVEEKEGVKDTGYDPDARRAKRGILQGSTLLVLVFLMDEMAQSRGIDIGYWPYLLSNLFLLYGGWFFAKQRGYSPLVRLLGLLNLIGIALIYLLPHRTTDTRPKKSRLLASVSAIAAIVIGLLWIHQYYQSQAAYHAHLEDFHTLRMQEGTYPAGILLEDGDSFYRRQDDVYRFVEDALMLLDEYSFRPDEVGDIGDHLFAAVAGHFIWLNYQRYLGTQAHAELPEYLTTAAIGQQRKMFRDLVMCYAEGEAGLNEYPRFVRAFQDWTTNCHTWDIVLVQCAEPGTKRSDKINAYLWQLYIHLRDQRYLQKRSREPHASQTGSSIPVYSKHIFSSIKMDHAGIIELHLTRDETGDAALSDKSLVMAFYQYPYKRFGKLKQATEFACIGGDLAPKYLQGSFNIFHDWLLEAQERPVRQSAPHRYSKSQ